MAVAAVCVALVYVLLLVGLGLGANAKKLPLVEIWLFGIAGLGVVLAFAARVRISNSEGTLTGIPYASAAWWVCVVGGLAYMAYFLTLEWTVRADAERALNEWTTQLKAANPNDPDDEAFNQAMLFMLPPNERVQAKDNLRLVKQNFGATPAYTSFRHSDLFPLLQRNKGQCEFVPQGLRSWKPGSGKLECDLSVLLRTPEGEFPMSVPMQAALDKDSKRHWQILRTEGFFQSLGSPKLSRYGWYVRRMEETAAAATQEFLATASGRPNRQPPGLIDLRYLTESQMGPRVGYQAYVSDTLPRPTAERILDTSFGRIAMGGCLTAFWGGDPNYADALSKSAFFSDAKGVAYPADSKDRVRFRYVFEHVQDGRIRLAGHGGTPGFPDKQSQVLIAASGIEVSFPVEIRPLDAQDPYSVARGRLVLTLADPALANQIRSEQTSGTKPLDDRPTDIAITPMTWRVVRIESDLKVTSYRPQGPPGGPPGM